MQHPCSGFIASIFVLTQGKMYCYSSMNSVTPWPICIPNPSSEREGCDEGEWFQFEPKLFLWLEFRVWGIVWKVSGTTQLEGIDWRNWHEKSVENNSLWSGNICMSLALTSVLHLRPQPTTPPSPEACFSHLPGRALHFLEATVPCLFNPLKLLLRKGQYRVHRFGGPVVLLMATLHKKWPPALPLPSP